MKITKGKSIGYIRVSTADQNPDRQLEGLDLDKKFIEYASGKDTKRPQLKALMEYIREDDVLYVHSIDRLARNLKDLFNLVDHFVSNKITVKFYKQNLTFDGNPCPSSKLQLSLLGAFAEFEREITLERQREGIAIAKKAGKYKGTQTKLTPEMVYHITEKMKTREPKSKIAEDLGISRAGLYKYMKIIKSRDENKVIQNFFLN